MRKSGHPIRRSAVGCLALGAILLLAACGEAPPDMDGDVVDQPPPQTPAAEPATGPEMVHATTPLEPVNGSGVSGEAMAMHTQEAVVIALEAEGLPDEREYAAHIHRGSCEDGGPVSVALNPVIGLADGTGSSTTTLDAEEVDEDEPLFIQMHGMGGAPVACGDIEGHRP